MITAHSTPATGFPVEEKPQPQYASFDEIMAAMEADAKNVRKRQRRNVYAAPARHEKPSEMQEAALLALKGIMNTNEVREIIGHDGASGFLSNLVTKGLVERRGYDGTTARWSRTRKGCKWVERNRGSGK